MFGKSERLLEDIDQLLNNHLTEKLNKEFANSFNLYLDKFIKMVDQEKELIENSATKAVEKIDNASNRLIRTDEILAANIKLSQEIKNLIKEIRRRDSIIERKNQQIAKLKDNK